jgi:hypothetical protein
LSNNYLNGTENSTEAALLFSGRQHSKDASHSPVGHNTGSASLAIRAKSKTSS